MEEVRGAQSHVHVEFFGLPGSGKTTIAQALHRRMSAADPTVVYSPDVTQDHKSVFPRTLVRALLIAREFPWHPSDWRALRAVATTRQQTPRDKAKVLFNYMTVASLYRRLASRGCPAVIDQGVLQAIWSANLRGLEPVSPEKWQPILLSASNSARFYVFVQSPAPICIERLMSRPGRHSRMQSPDLLDQHELWAHSERVHAHLAGGLTSCFRRQGLVPRVVIVDGTRDPDEVAEGILAKVYDAGPHCGDSKVV